ncbi:MAG: YidB family protein [Caulobacterales bacterium]
MGLLQSILGGLLGGKGGLQGALMGAVGELLNQPGGMGGLVQKFEQAGMGDIIKGWISTGPSPAINAGQLASALGPDTIKALAAKTGLDQNALLGGLAAQLPQLIDQLTPDGNAVEGDQLQKALGGLLGKLGGK